MGQVLIVFSALVAATLAAPQGYAAEPAYPDEPALYTYTYAVKDDYTNSNFGTEERRDGPNTQDHTMSPCLMGAYRRLPTLSVEMVAMWLMSPMKELLSILRTSLMFLLLLMLLPSRYGGNKPQTKSC